MKKSILFFANSVEFNPNTILERGLGGTETAIIYMARELARLKNEITVVCPCKAPGNYDGVLYKDIKEFDKSFLGKGLDVIVVSRILDVFKDILPARLKVLWTEDAYDQPFLKDLGDKNIQKGIDKILTVSKWQTMTMIRHFGIPPEKFIISRNGINRDFYDSFECERTVGRLVYTSTPFRGLDVLLDVFPRIKERVSCSELHIYSSMSVYGISKECDRKLYGNLYAKCNQPGVYLKGSISQKQLADELKKSYMMIYPNHFAETSCIAALEAQAAGLPVVTTRLGALSETVIHNRTGICIPGESKSKDYQERFINDVVRLMNNKDEWQKMSENAHNTTIERYSWDIIAKEWDVELDRELKRGIPTLPADRQNPGPDRRVPTCRLPADKAGTGRDRTRAGRNSIQRHGQTPHFQIQGKKCGVHATQSEIVNRKSEIANPTLSLCMIVKNEEDSLSKCLQKTKSFVDEIIVVDTGSDDKTIEIAKRHGAKVYNYKWDDDFSKAKNISIGYATGDWILSLDADEVISESDMQKILELVKNTQHAGFNLIQRTYENYSGYLGWVENITNYSEGKGYPGYIDSPLVRLFRNRKGLRFKGRVHELVDSSCLKNDKAVVNTSIVIHHYGKDKDQKCLNTKGDLYLSVGIKKIKDNPYDAKAHFDLGVQCAQREAFHDAVKYLEKTIDLSPEYYEAYENLGCAYISLNNYEQAEIYLKRAVNLQSKSKSAHYNLGRLYYMKREIKLAYDFYRTALKISPDYINAIKGMGTLYIAIGKYEEAKILLYKALQKAKDAEVYNNLGCLEKKEGLYARSIFFFSKAVELAPDNQVIMNNLKNVQKRIAEDKTFRNLQSAIRNPTISLCMIVKNEEHNLARCLKSVKCVVDEIIIVDTGSTDSTVEIAKGYGAKVYHHAWEKSFSKARNYSLKYATCDWVFILDADEELHNDDAPELKELIKNKNYEAVSFVIRNKFNNSTQESYTNMIRLFKNYTGTCYEGIVHNSLKCSGRCLESSLSIIHHGYNLSKDKMEEKFVRTSSLLKRQIESNPHDPVPHRYLGISYMGEGLYDEAIEECKISLELVERSGSISKEFLVSYYIISASYFEKEELKESERYALEGTRLNDRFLDGFCILSFVYYNLKKYDKFLRYSTRYFALWDAIKKNPGSFDNLDSHTIGHKWKIHLLSGFYYLSNGQAEKGNIEIDRALKESTDMEDCLKLLGNYYLENNCLDKAEEAYEKLLAVNKTPVDVLIKMGHIKFKMGDTENTIYYWNKAVDIDPTMFDIRLLICKLYIAQDNYEEVISNCNHLLRDLKIHRSITLESLSDLANFFNIIGETLNEREDIQAAQTAFKICENLKQIS